MLLKRPWQLSGGNTYCLSHCGWSHIWKYSFLSSPFGVNTLGISKCSKLEWISLTLKAIENVLVAAVVHLGLSLATHCTSYRLSSITSRSSQVTPQVKTAFILPFSLTFSRSSILWFAASNPKVLSSKLSMSPLASSMVRGSSSWSPTYTDCSSSQRFIKYGASFLGGFIFTCNRTLS